jgi:hypothetical protein
MLKEFETLKALLHVSDPSDWEPQVDRGEAAKLAARWGWLVRRVREKRADLIQKRQPDLSVLLGPRDGPPGRP